MDSFEGRSLDPFSLHKYLYANADPVNVVDPTGQTAATLAEVPNVAWIIGMMVRAIWPAFRPVMVATTAVVVILTLHYAVTAIELEDLVVWSSNRDTEKVVNGLLDQAAEHAAKLASLGGGDPQDPNNWDRNKWKREVKAHLERAKRLVEKRLKHSKSKAQEYLQRIQEIADKSGITMD